jgi:hypothetical protein|tara:strand:+ start:326 stop:1078 length:753 start_codon:yes stop_codon:yes gene_type:complete
MSTFSALVSPPRAVGCGVRITASARRKVSGKRATVRTSASDDASGSSASVRIFSGSSKEMLFGAQQNMLGLLESPSTDDDAITASIAELSTLNPTAAPAKDAKLVGKWRLAWSQQQESSNFFQKLFADIASDNFQIINEDNTLENLVLLGPLTVSAKAPIAAVSETRTEVRISTVDVSIAGNTVWSKTLTPKPGKGAGWVEQLYLDDEMRISRGNKGSLFIHTREGGGGNKRQKPNQGTTGQSATALVKL